MQTFLPFPDFEQSLKVLDYKRLGKQRVECKQLLKALRAYPLHLITDYNEREKYVHAPFSKGWINHPAAKMWLGYEQALIVYHNEAILQWIDRGYKNTMPLIPNDGYITMPPWLGNASFHRAHRSNLIRKDPAYYRDQCGWTDPDDLEYIWPTKEGVAA